MPHLRHRILEEMIRKDLTWSPVVSVLGMRQIGKTTLLRQICDSYITLDQEETLQKLERGDWSKVESSRPPTVIDEAQKSPGLFDRVKLLVDRRKRPGQFVLTGSVRFLSRKQIRESLTGRTSLLELLPLTLAEAHSRPSNNFVELIAEGDPKHPQKAIEMLSDQKHATSTEVQNYLRHGGMPGICFKRDETIQSRMRESHLETLLMRDLQLLIRTTVPFVKLKSILTTMAQGHTLGFSASSIGRQVQLSTPTVLQMIRAFEDLFIVRPLGKEWYFTDVGMASYLGAERINNPLFHMERFAYQELYAQLNYSHRGLFKFQSYTTRGGVRIPFLIQIKNSPWIAITIDASEGGSEKSLKGLTWFSKKSKEPIIGVVLHHGSTSYVSSTGALCLPLHWLA